MMDLPYIQRYAVRPEFYRYLPIPKQTPDTVAQFLEGRLDDLEQGQDNRIILAVEPKDLQHIIGSVRIEILDTTNQSGDLGFALDADYQQQGYMTEAVRCVLDHGFNHLRLHRVWATADIENKPSWRLMERVGMQREGHLRENVMIRDKWRDSYLYSKLASDQRT